LILLTTLISAISIATAAALCVAVSGKVTLSSRLEQMVPGSGLDLTRVAKQRRVSKLSKRMRRQIDDELPDLIDLACGALLTGQSLHAAIERVASRSNSIVASELQVFLRNVSLGRSLSSELAALCERKPTAAMKEFVNKISLSIARGTPLAESFEALSASLRERRGFDLLKRAGANETKMLIPLVALVLPTTVLFALYPSMLVLNIGFN
jgi:tight adherence protein C